MFRRMYWEHGSLLQSESVLRMLRDVAGVSQVLSEQTFPTAPGPCRKIQTSVAGLCVE